VHDAVGVDVEGDLDLRDAARGRRMPVSSKVPSACCARHLALALEDLDRTDGWLSSAVVKVSSAWSGWWCCAR
jgi:hypothetical protein